MGRKVTDMSKNRGPCPDLKKRWINGSGRVGDIVAIFMYFSSLGI